MCYSCYSCCCPYGSCCGSYSYSNSVIVAVNRVMVAAMAAVDLGVKKSLQNEI